MTAKEELINDAWEAARKKNLENGQNQVNAVEALDWLAEQYLRLLVKSRKEKRK